MPERPSTIAVPVWVPALFGLALTMVPTWTVARADAQRAPLQAESHLEQKEILSTGTTATNGPIRYPFGAAARLTAIEITLLPGQETGWHQHPVPIFGYILEGELTVDYGPYGSQTYRKGDGFVEAMGEVHEGRNAGQGPVKILAVVIGQDGLPGSIPASPPPR